MKFRISRVAEIAFVSAALFGSSALVAESVPLKALPYSFEAAELQKAVKAARESVPPRTGKSPHFIAGADVLDYGLPVAEPSWGIERKSSFLYFSRSLKGEAFLSWLEAADRVRQILADSLRLEENEKRRAALEEKAWSELLVKFYKVKTNPKKHRFIIKLTKDDVSILK